MTLQELQNRVPEYRVASNSNSSDTAFAQNIRERMIGDEFEAQAIDFKNGEVYLRGLWFKFSDVQELTPLSYNGKRIAIGDEVKWEDEWHTVYGYHWSGGEWQVDAVRANDFESYCYDFSFECIEDHRTPQAKEVVDDATEKAIALLKENGYKIVKE